MRNASEPMGGILSSHWIKGKRRQVRKRGKEEKVAEAEDRKLEWKEMEQVGGNGWWRQRVV